MIHELQSDAGVLPLSSGHCAGGAVLLVLLLLGFAFAFFPVLVLLLVLVKDRGGVGARGTRSPESGVFSDDSVPLALQLGK